MFEVTIVGDDTAALVAQMKRFIEAFSAKAEATAPRRETPAHHSDEARTRR